MTFRRLLKDVAAGSYYAPDGSWTANVAEACDFPDTLAAVRVAQKLGTKNLHLVLKFQDSRMDISHALEEISRPSSGAAAGVLLSVLVPLASAAARL